MKLILVVSLFSLSVYAVSGEASWKTNLRNIITSVAGVEWSEKILGPLPVEELEITLPAIPKNFKKNTDVSSYTKKVKPQTAYEKLPATRRQQFDYQFIKELYYVTRKSEVKDEDLSNWLNTLDQGGSREGIYQALVLDDVYASLENVQEKASPKLIAFAKDFSQKFLQQTFTDQAVAQFNLYTLKRILTEKSLDILEYYEVNDLEAMNRWYALASVELAPTQTSELRQNTSAEFHYEWAKAMPVQHIKSEVIIKLHARMNGLQVQM